MPIFAKKKERMTSKNIRQQISGFESGRVFRVEDLGLLRTEQQAAVVTLGRLVQQGEIQRLSPGNYYKPKKTAFGVVGPSLEDRFRDLFYDKDTPIAYLTGLYAFNLLGLTTQQPTVLEIGSNFPQRGKTRGIYTVRFVLQKNPITADNIEMLRVLDSLKWIKKIPDTTVDRSYTLLKELVGGYMKAKQAVLVELSMKYSPLTRALLGSMLTDDKLSTKLSQSLNPLTRFSVGFSSVQIPNEWNIR